MDHEEAYEDAWKAWTKNASRLWKGCIIFIFSFSRLLIQDAAKKQNWRKRFLTFFLLTIEDDESIYTYNQKKRNVLSNKVKKVEVLEFSAGNTKNENSKYTFNILKKELNVNGKTLIFDIAEIHFRNKKQYPNKHEKQEHSNANNAEYWNIKKRKQRKVFEQKSFRTTNF